VVLYADDRSDLSNFRNLRRVRASLFRKVTSPSCNLPLPNVPSGLPQSGEPYSASRKGPFELWSFPVKMLSQFRITAELSTYPVHQS
jgi:hypothetical protein